MKQELHTEAAVRAHLADPERDWSQTVVQDVDLTGNDLDRALRGEDLAHGVFLGCRMGNELLLQATAQGALVFRHPEALAFAPYRPALYDHEALFAGFDPARPESYLETTDWRAYREAMDPETSRRKADASIDAVMFQRLHDLSMGEALDDWLRGRDGGRRPVVGIMGGHDLVRAPMENGEPSPYLRVAQLARSLNRRGFTVATGGGPGAMEAANLGAWMADRSLAELNEAAAMLAAFPKIRRGAAGSWLASAYAVIERFPRAVADPRTESVGIPTWFYGHEPPNPFASRIAKFFDNSLREEAVLGVADGGIVFTPGNAGTVQEIFQDACQNYYQTYGHQAPMVLLGRNYWNAPTAPNADRTKPAWNLLRQLASEKGFGDRLHLTDGIQDAVLFLERWRPAAITAP